MRPGVRSSAWRACRWMTHMNRQTNRQIERKKERKNNLFPPTTHTYHPNTHTRLLSDQFVLLTCGVVLKKRFNVIFFNDLCFVYRKRFMICLFLWSLKKLFKFEIFHVPSSSQSFVWTDKKLVVKLDGFERSSIQWSTRSNSNKSCCLSLQIIIRVNCVHKHTKEHIEKTVKFVDCISFSFSFISQLCWRTITRWHELQSADRKSCFFFQNKDKRQKVDSNHYLLQWQWTRQPRCPQSAATTTHTTLTMVATLLEDPITTGSPIQHLTSIQKFLSKSSAIRCLLF